MTATTETGTRGTLPRSERTVSLRVPVAAGPVSRTEQWIVLLALAWLFIGPRVELPFFAGPRLEDLVFVVLAVLCARRALPLRRPSGPTAGILAVVATGVVAAVVGVALGTVPLSTSLLYAVRPLEYWIAFPATRLLLGADDRTGRRRLNLLLAATTVLQAAFAAAQSLLSWDVGFSHAAYTRAAGLTVGPYELGAIAAVLVVYWLSRRRFVLAAVAAVALGLSISRISILGAGVGVAVLAGGALVVRLRRDRPARPSMADRLRAGGRSSLIRLAAAAGISALALGLVLGFAASPAGGTAVQRATAPIAERFTTTSVLGSWTAAAPLAAAVPPLRTAAEYQEIAYERLNQYVQAGDAAASGAEPSNLVRFFRWHLILDTVDDPRKMLLGLGPSFVGPSVDGSYLRFFADAGLIGLAAWVTMIVMWLRRTPIWMVSVTTTLLVGAVFIDIVYAERPMALYWTLLAVALHPAAATQLRGRHRGAPPAAGPRARPIRTGRPA